MEALAEYALDVATEYGATYADVRIIRNESQNIQTKNNSVSGFQESGSYGLGVRTLLGGWGFSSTKDMTKPGIERAVRLAIETARASATCRQSPVTLLPEPTHKATWKSPCEVDPFTVSVEKKITTLLDAAKVMLAVPGITLATGELTFIREEKFFASSEGSRIKQEFIRSGCWIQANATNDDDQQRRSWPQQYGQQELAGWEMVEKWDLVGNAQKIAEEAVALLSAPQCPQGEMDLVLDSSQLALQIHESCGHPTELDRALRWEINFAGYSFLTPEKLHNLKYGSTIVNLVADATAPGALGSFGYDDDGVAAQRVFLVKDGTFSGYLSSRETGYEIGLTRSGGMMRAESWHYTPIIRMTNISLVPGSAGKLADIIANTESGIFMETNKSWSIDGRRYNFQFSTEIGWEIKNGKLGRMLKNPSYSGVTPQFWNSCDAIGGVEEYVHWGLPNCGKGQPCQLMWTGHGASPARFRKTQVGIARSK
jgi:TldD protein